MHFYLPCDVNVHKIAFSMSKVKYGLVNQELINWLNYLLI
jgi:hypothetical protein